jgi:hypothetical protein
MALAMVIFFLTFMQVLANLFVIRLPQRVAVLWMFFAAGVVWLVLTDQSGFVASMGLDRTPLLSSLVVFWLFLTAVCVYRHRRKARWY